MKILQVHNRYQHAGGEDSVVRMEKELLEQYGHEVVQFLADNDDIQGLTKKIKVALSTHYSKASKRAMKDYLDRYEPDVVHVHNFFPKLTPSIFDACSERGVPTVMTLHNYRLICPGALFMRDGKVCEKCLQGGPYHAVRYGCYKSSRIGSWSVARMISYHRKANTWHHKVDRFIALTEFAKSKFTEAGFPEGKIVVKPNFYSGVAPSSETERHGA
ncbi:MAG: glycosyltransferase family 1 protein, partial [Methanobacteriota archaeon]